jgi:hypothetical protein
MSSVLEAWEVTRPVRYLHLDRAIFRAGFMTPVYARQLYGAYSPPVYFDRHKLKHKKRDLPPCALRFEDRNNARRLKGGILVVVVFHPVERRKRLASAIYLINFAPPDLLEPLASWL